LFGSFWGRGVAAVRFASCAVTVAISPFFTANLAWDGEGLEGITSVDEAWAPRTKNQRRLAIQEGAEAGVAGAAYWQRGAIR